MPVIYHKKPFNFRAQQDCKLATPQSNLAQYSSFVTSNDDLKQNPIYSHMVPDTKTFYLYNFKIANDHETRKFW
ncbi:hypothetical protein RO3G_00317 [Rhizopus delemar RA 99-880]|uniref:Uncharacterized protein n=1 Tax=Rhizopus delemar (strain RA 99-880 / ATCC MYA-4621 / FGSC 9543 / NRRL 43880) TaxID=246409 RepID=I1BHD3_RHIO9|nr:hypothetical protein RO3G_00317 [Rhizopus delemar RA 99-880]|eukprot:EIE75613.1 hypothetical protein RO3G_00317 [Rhizopus delemar RA 99-880]